jgi:hypothetical protein
VRLQLLRDSRCFSLLSCARRALLGLSLPTVSHPQSQSHTLCQHTRA